MRHTPILLAIGVAACGGDDGPRGTPDAMPDASGVIAPIAVTFERVGAQAEGPNTQLTFGPSGLLYSQQSGFLEVSSDQGITWTRKAQGAIQGLAATTTTLFATVLQAGAASPQRSIDGGTTFTPLTIPGFAVGDGVSLHVAGQTAWAYVIAIPSLAPKGLARSTDQGATFSPVTLPGTFARASLTAGGDGSLFLVGDHHVYRTNDGSVWEDLGQFTEVMSVFGTQAGTALMYTRTAGQISLNRRAAAASTWTTEAPIGQFPPTILQRPSGELIRIGYMAAIDASSTEGTAWTSVLAAGQISGDGVSGVFALDGALLGVTFDGGELLPARYTTGGLRWGTPTPTTIPSGTRAVDLSFTSNGRVVLAGSRQVFTSSDNGVTWHRGAYLVDESSPIRAAAVSPDGARIFIGSTYSRRGFLAGDGDSALFPFSTNVPPSTEHVRQAAWSSNQHLFVTTASDDNTEGSVYDGDFDRAVSLWQPVNPFRNELNPQLDPTAGFHGIAACPFVDTFAVLIGARQWTGTNAYQDHLLIQYRYLQDGWEHLEPPIGFGQAQSISCTQSGTVALLYRDEFLYVGGWHLGFHAISETTLDGAPQIARLAPDGRLWVLSDNGLFRSTAPVVIP